NNDIVAFREGLHSGLEAAQDRRIPPARAPSVIGLRVSSQSQESGLDGLRQRLGASRLTPSAGACCSTFQSGFVEHDPFPKTGSRFSGIMLDAAVLLPESFRGGCSFGAGLGEIEADLSRYAGYVRRPHHDCNGRRIQT